MGRVFRKPGTRPIPKGAEIFTHKGIEKARWQSKGTTYTAIVEGDRIKTLSKVYYARWRDAHGVIREASTRCRDKGMALQWLAKKEADVQRHLAGVTTESEIIMAENKKRAILDTVEAFKTSKKLQGVTKKHRKETASIITRAAKACRWHTLGDMNTAEAHNWILARVERDGISYRTCQKTVVALGDFGSWCASPAQALLAVNPFQELKWTGRKERVYERRPFTVEELIKIIEAARIQPLLAAQKGSGITQKDEDTEKGKETTCNLSEAFKDKLLWKGYTRATVYQVMAMTGLRWGECRKLTIGNVDLKAGIITLQAKNEKNRKGSVLPLSDENRVLMADYMAERIERLTGGNTAFPKAYNHKPFFDGLPLSMAKALKKDCAIAKVEVKDFSEKVLDMHSLRHFFATELMRAGVPPTTGQALMRHSTLQLMSIYAHTSMEDKEEALNKLPTFNKQVQTTEKAVSYAPPYAPLDDGSERYSMGSFGTIHTDFPKSSPKKNPATTGIITNDCRGDMVDEMVPRGGIEPPTRGFSVRCSTD